jgi:D-beta-D-heptose 7-phosphate kinase/D-beta-D-heptose 1-phosphate adenosyltransferase
MLLVSSEHPEYHIPTRAREVFDVSGAGDTVIAVSLLALASGASHQEAAELANYAAGIVVGKLGTAACSRDDLLSIFNDG